MDRSVTLNSHDSRLEGPGSIQQVYPVRPYFWLGPWNPWATPFYFWLGLTVAVIYAALPVLTHGFTFPPGDDPVRLQSNLETLGLASRYYGHYPAKLLGMTLYYYSTPALVYLGLWFLLSRYGKVLPLATWGALFLINRTLLFDLYAGTFVGLVSFYFLGFGILRLYARAAERKRGGWIILAAPVLVLFHSFTGLVLSLGMIGYALATRRPAALLLALCMGLGVLASAWLLGSSIARLGIVPSIDSPYVGATIEYSRMGFPRFISEYLGLGSLLVITAGALAGLNALMRGWRPAPDFALTVLAITVIPLSIATFTDLALNADRTAKLLMGVLVVLSMYTVWATVPYFRSAALTGIMGVALLLAFAVSAPEVFPYWLGLGSFR